MAFDPLNWVEQSQHPHEDRPFMLALGNCSYPERVQLIAMIAGIECSLY